ncbi:hypothetical protein ACFE04_012202 [Oxalis oulophora]
MALLPMPILVCSLVLFLFSSTASACDRCVHKSKVAYFSKDSALSSGACGYGSLAMDFNGGHLAAAVPSIYQAGVGCGACFQIRCKKASICSSKGTKVIVTDLNYNNGTDFVVSSRAFRDMANQGKDRDLFKLGLVDVEYKRILCDYKKSMAVRVEEFSKNPDYLALKVLYQGGQTEIVDVEVATVGNNNWSYMSRNYGAVFNTSRVPKGPLQMRFVVTGGYDGKWYWAQKQVLPADWKIGVIYDTGLLIDDIKQEGPCNPCDNSTWK